MSRHSGIYQCVCTTDPCVMAIMYVRTEEYIPSRWAYVLMTKCVEPGDQTQRTAYVAWSLVTSLINQEAGGCGATCRCVRRLAAAIRLYTQRAGLCATRTGNYQLQEATVSTYWMAQCGSVRRQYNLPCTGFPVAVGRTVRCCVYRSARARRSPAAIHSYTSNSRVAGAGSNLETGGGRAGPGHACKKKEEAMAGTVVKAPADQGSKTQTFIYLLLSIMTVLLPAGAF
jgi:hypothetical protein